MYRRCEFLGGLWIYDASYFRGITTANISKRKTMKHVHRRKCTTSSSLYHLCDSPQLHARFSNKHTCIRMCPRTGLWWTRLTVKARFSSLTTMSVMLSSGIQCTRSGRTFETRCTPRTCDYPVAGCFWKNVAARYLECLSQIEKRQAYCAETGMEIAWKFWSEGYRMRCRTFGTSCMRIVSDRHCKISCTVRRMYCLPLRTIIAVCSIVTDIYDESMLFLSFTANVLFAARVTTLINPRHSNLCTQGVHIWFNRNVLSTFEIKSESWVQLHLCD